MIFTRGPEDSLIVLRVLAEQQSSTATVPPLRRYDRKPRRLASLKLHLLQGFPGIGPTLAERLLERFGSIEGIVRADEAALATVARLGPKKATAIRRVLA